MELFEVRKMQPHNDPALRTGQTGKIQVFSKTDQEELAGSMVCAEIFLEKRFHQRNISLPQKMEA